MTAGQIQPLKALIGLSVVVLTIRAALFILIGSSVPLIGMGVVCAVFAMSILIGGKGLALLSSLWGIILIMAGLARAVLLVLMSMQPGLSVQGSEIVNPVYIALTLILMVSGFYIVRNAKQLKRKPTFQ